MARGLRSPTPKPLADPKPFALNLDRQAQPEPLCFRSLPKGYLALYLLDAQSIKHVVQTLLRWTQLPQALQRWTWLSMIGSLVMPLSDHCVFVRSPHPQWGYLVQNLAQ